MADIARMDYRIKLSFIGEKWGLIIEYRLNFKPTFWTGLVYAAESPQDLKKSVNKPELTQKVLRKSFKFWALSGLFALF